MATTENSTPLVTPDNIQQISGVTYYKLESAFDGDNTKYCGLETEEVDGNFYFLRGYDISGVTTNENGQLVITRVDPAYSPIIVTLPTPEENEDEDEEFVPPTLSYDKETGELTVTYPDGTEVSVDGFMIETPNSEGFLNVRIASDNTLKGDGTRNKPLGLSLSERTGTYAPASEYLDISANNVMPDGKNYGRGYRILTKEKFDPFGMLYPYEAVEMIQEKLEETLSEWHVPSKEDWDELLNAMEPCGSRNHSGTSIGEYGAVAGQVLKSSKDAKGNDFWKPFDDGDNYNEGQDIVGMTIYPVGVVPYRNSIMQDDDNDAEGYGMLTEQWTNTQNAFGVYTKVFAYNSAGVKQAVENPEAKYSLRLVKDFKDTNYYEFEDILGTTYPCIQVISPFEDTDYNKVWTSINIGYTDSALKGVRSDQWSAATDTERGVKDIYYVCEYDGTKWVKKSLKEGDSVVIINYEDNEELAYHEWRIVNGELIDTLAATQLAISNITDNLSELSAATVALSNTVADTISDLKTLSGETVALSNTVADTISDLDTLSGETVLLSGLIADTISDLKTLSGETAALSASTADLSSKLSDLSGSTISLTNTLNEFSASTVSGMTDLSNSDVKAGVYTLNGDSDSEMVLPTKGDNTDDMKIKISEDFFNFGNIIND